MMERKGHCKCDAGKPDCPVCNAEGGDDTPPLLVRESDTVRPSLAAEHTRQRLRRRPVSSQRMKDLAKTFASHHPVFQPSLDEREHQYQDYSGPRSCVADKYFGYHSEDVLTFGPRPGLEGSCQPGTPAPSPDGDQFMLPSRSPKPEPLQPETGKPETRKPEPLQPETGKPETRQPEPLQPETGKPEPLQPETGQPETREPEPIEM